MRDYITVREALTTLLAVVALCATIAGYVALCFFVDDVRGMLGL